MNQKQMKEFMKAFNSIVEEKGINKQVVVDGMEQAMAAAYKRETGIPNVMAKVDEIQAEYVAEIKLRHLNREYILKCLDETDKLKDEIEELESILQSPAKVKNILIDELKSVIKKFGQPRKSKLLYAAELEEEPEIEDTPDYPVHLFFTKEGYFKKITPQALRMSGEQKVKEGDEMLLEIEATNNTDLLFFTDKCQVYKSKAAEFELGKASQLGDFVASKLEMDEGETAIYMVATLDYKGYVMFFFENGKAAKVDLSAYETKTNRKKLIKA